MNPIFSLKRHFPVTPAIAALSVVTCIAWQASAQTPVDQSGAAQQNPSAAPDVQRTMTIHVQVSDSQAHAIEGLQESDFILLDNKQPQKLLGFRAVDAAVLKSDPVQVVIVVDMVNSDPVTVAREREEVGAYLKSNGGELLNPTSLAVIADSGVKVLPLSSQRGDLLLASFNQTQSEIRQVGRSAGFYGATENAQKSLQEMGQLIQYEGQKPGRKMVVFVSPGWPLLIAAGEQSDSKQRTWVFNSVVQMTNLLRASDVTLYCVDPFDLGEKKSVRIRGIPERRFGTQGCHISRSRPSGIRDTHGRTGVCQWPRYRRFVEDCYSRSERGLRH